VQMDNETSIKSLANAVTNKSNTFTYLFLYGNKVAFEAKHLECLDDELVPNAMHGSVGEHKAGSRVGLTKTYKVKVNSIT